METKEPMQDLLSDLNIKLVAPADPRLYEPRTSSYLLNQEVLEDLKQAIRQVKDAQPDWPRNPSPNRASNFREE